MSVGFYSETIAEVAGVESEGTNDDAYDALWGVEMIDTNIVSSYEFNTEDIVVEKEPILPPNGSSLTDSSQNSNSRVVGSGNIVLSTSSLAGLVVVCLLAAWHLQRKRTSKRGSKTAIYLVEDLLQWCKGLLISLQDDALVTKNSLDADRLFFLLKLTANKLVEDIHIAQQRDSNATSSTSNNSTTIRREILVVSPAGFRNIDSSVHSSILAYNDTLTELTAVINRLMNHLSPALRGGGGVYASTYDESRSRFDIDEQLICSDLLSALCDIDTSLDPARATVQSYKYARERDPGDEAVEKLRQLLEEGEDDHQHQNQHHHHHHHHQDIDTRISRFIGALAACEEYNRGRVHVCIRAREKLEDLREQERREEEETLRRELSLEQNSLLKNLKAIHNLHQQSFAGSSSSSSSQRQRQLDNGSCPSLHSHHQHTPFSTSASASASASDSWTTTSVVAQDSDVSTTTTTTTSVTTAAAAAITTATVTAASSAPPLSCMDTQTTMQGGYTEEYFMVSEDSDFLAAGGGSGISSSLIVEVSSSFSDIDIDDTDATRSERSATATPATLQSEIDRIQSGVAGLNIDETVVSASTTSTNTDHSDTETDTATSHIHPAAATVVSSPPSSSSPTTDTVSVISTTASSSTAGVYLPADTDTLVEEAVRQQQHHQQQQQQSIVAMTEVLVTSQFAMETDRIRREKTSRLEARRDRRNWERNTIEREARAEARRKRVDLEQQMKNRGLELENQNAQRQQGRESAREQGTGNRRRDLEQQRKTAKKRQHNLDFLVFVCVAVCVCCAYCTGMSDRGLRVVTDFKLSDVGVWAVSRTRVLCRQLAAVDSRPSSSSFEAIMDITTTGRRACSSATSDSYYHQCGTADSESSSPSPIITDKTTPPARNADTVSADMDEMDHRDNHADAPQENMIHGSTILKPPGAATASSFSGGLWPIESMYSYLASRVIWAWISVLQAWGMDVAWVAADVLVCLVARIGVRCVVPLVFSRILRLAELPVIAWWVYYVSVGISLGWPLVEALGPMWPLFWLLSAHSILYCYLREYDQGITWKIRDVLSSSQRRSDLSIESITKYIRTQQQRLRESSSSHHHRHHEDDSMDISNEFDVHRFTIRRANSLISWLGGIDYRWLLLYVTYPLALVFVSSIVGWLYAEENQYTKSSLYRMIRAQFAESEAERDVYTVVASLMDSTYEAAEMLSVAVKAIYWKLKV